MVEIAPQYNDTLTWITRQVQTDVDDWGQPVYEEEMGEVVGRYENFRQGQKKEFLGVDGVTIIQYDGVFYCKSGQDVPNRFDEVIVRDTKFQVLHTYNGFYNATIYLKEVK